MKDDNGKKSLADVLSNNIKLIIVIISLITALIMLFVAYAELRDTSVQTPTPTPAITPLPVTVRGTVTYENKNIVTDAKVSIEGQSSMTDNDGRYAIPDILTGVKIIRVVRDGEEIFKSDITIGKGNEVMTFNIIVPVPAIAETPEPTLPQTTAQTPTPTQAPTSAEGIDQFQIDWGTMDAYFDISGVTIGTTQTTDILGMVSEYDSINFIVEAKRSFDAIILFEATFYDDNRIEVYSSGVYFNPDYNRWEPGVRAEGYMMLPSTGMEEIRFIEVSQFAY
ncbi:MAG: carboxypeptidase regulatory-like domain-containing protein [Methanosarcinales archaeon]|nr:carboxypeptidase regulatory-like domain-containing protein [Methanosarcinales archaeon]